MEITSGVREQDDSELYTKKQKHKKHNNKQANCFVTRRLSSPSGKKGDKLGFRCAKNESCLNLGT